MTTAPPFAGPVSTMLPNPEQGRLLRAALWPPEAARKALLDWQDRGPRPAARLARDHSGGKLLAPLICANLREAHVGGLSERLLTYLRTALVREELRSEAYRQILGDLLRALAQGGPPVILLGGAALAETVYPRPELRHSHGILLMTREETEARTASILTSTGFQVAPRVAGPPGDPLAAVHSSGLPLRLVHTPPTFGHYRPSGEDLWSRAKERIVQGSPVKVLSPADQLFQVCVRTVTGERRGTLLWACDVWHLLAAESELDWTRVTGRAASSGASLPLWVLLDYLSDELEAAVPGSVLDRLATDAERPDRLAVEVALTGAAWRPGPKLLPMLRAAGTWRERLLVVRWRMLPSPAALEATGRIAERSRAPLFYVVRPFRSGLQKARYLIGPTRREGLRVPTRPGSPP